MDLKYVFCRFTRRMDIFHLNNWFFFRVKSWKLRRQHLAENIIRAFLLLQQHLHFTIRFGFQARGRDVPSTQWGARWYYRRLCPFVSSGNREFSGTPAVPQGTHPSTAPAGHAAPTNTTRRELAAAAVGLYLFSPTNFPNYITIQSHYFNITITLQSHYNHITITLLLHYNYITITLLLH